QSRCPSSSHSSVIDIDADSGRCSWRRVPKLPSLILKNNSDGSENGSLQQIMNRTLNIFGSRLLRHWVSHPLYDQTMISACLHAVSKIAESIK
ncbi:hypothetical protein S83_066497, partial [Arachis hypogaea]